jgi:glycerol-3-phosphate dehydrogenase
MKVSVLGCGRWGSFISWYLNRTGHEVCEWGRENSPSFNVLKNTGKNEYVELAKTIKLTSNLKEALEFSDTIVISISSQSLREFMKSVVNIGVKDKDFVLCMKGIETSTGKRLSEVLIESGVDKNHVAVWVGPGHIQAFLQNKPNCMVIDSLNKALVKKLADGFRSDLIRFYYGDDLIGSEIGAAAKNVIGIAAGMLDGGDYSTLKGPLMARGAREISRLIKDELIRNASKGLETRVTDLNGNWKLTYAIYKRQYDNAMVVGLACYNETRMLMAPKYRPLILEGEVDEDFGPEEALEAVVTAFVAKQFGVFKAEELKD